MKTYKFHFFAFLTFIVLAGNFWFFNTYGEWQKPIIKIEEDINAIGLSKVVKISFSDQKRGLRDISVTISQDNRKHILSSVNYPDAGIKEDTFTIVVDPITLKLGNGTAKFAIAATDYSLFKNQTIIEKLVNIDMIPPQISLLTKMNHINPGGTCIVAYVLSEPVIMTGVKVEDIFFRSYPTTISGKPTMLSYFALPLSARHGQTTIKILAQDEAGNMSAINVPAIIMNKKFRSDKMNITETFLLQKMPEFQAQFTFLREKTPLETFTYINSLMREENNRVIREICRYSTPKQLWQDTFLRMKNAAPMAGFGEHRYYEYQKKRIGESTHMGVDLASIANAPVESANNGKVTYIGNLGIYGNTVIIDHGLGLFTLYAHLNSTSVKVGQEINKGELLGTTGMTGLAGGDHLHFSVIVGGEFVNPQEWWDPHWIKDNITKKLDISI